MNNDNWYQRVQQIIKKKNLKKNEPRKLKKHQIEQKLYRTYSEIQFELVITEWKSIFHFARSLRAVNF